MNNSSLVLSQNNFEGGVSNKKVFTSLDMTKEENIDRILATQDNESMKYLKDVKGEVLDVIGVYVTERTVEDFNEEGEAFNRYKHVTILFTSDGNQYVTGSNAFFTSLDLICQLKGYPTEEKPMKLKITEAPAKENGHTYLKCSIVK